MAKKGKNAAKKGEDHTQLVSILSYILVGIIWYFVDDSVQNKVTKFHVKQALVLLIAWVVLGIVASVLVAIPFIGLLFAILVWVVQVVGVVLVIVGIVRAVNGKQKPLPIIGGLAEKLRF